MTDPSPRHRYRGRALALLLAGALPALLGVTALPAQAETFQYWSLWEEKNGSWSASQSAASGMEVSDAGVVGARYVETEEELKKSDAPRTEPDYDALCPDQDPQEGEVAVAVVIDYGDPAIAPSGSTPPGAETACVSVPSPATGAAALSAATTVTASAEGFITAIDNYPPVDGASSSDDTSGESGDDSAAGQDTANSEHDDGFDWAPFALVGITLLLILLIALRAFVRKRNHEEPEE